jgi:hypothetical protein
MLPGRALPVYDGAPDGALMVDAILEV